MTPIHALATRLLVLEVPCDLHAARAACREAREFLAEERLTAEELDGWELALAEAANNAVLYAAPEGRSQPVLIEVSAREGLVEVRITDHTPGFDMPLRAAEAPPDAEKGRGIFLIQRLTDRAVYLRGTGENCMVLRKARTAVPTAPRTKLSPQQELEETRLTLDLMTEELSSSYESLSAIFRFSAELQAGGGSDDFTRRWLNHLLIVTEADWFVLRLADQKSQALHVGASSAASWLRSLANAEDPAQKLCVGASSAANWLSEPIVLKATAEPGTPVEGRAAAERFDVWFDAKAPLPACDPIAAFGTDSSGFAHPIIVNGQLVGVLTIGRQASDPSFRAGQVNIIHTFADFLGIQIRSQQIHAEQVRARLDTRDLEIAANIQQSLLPDPERLPSAPEACLAPFYRSARVIGGDYYDVLSSEAGGVLLVVADVMGKGIPAALFAFMFRSLVHARRDLAPQPAEFLAWLNRNLFHELDRAGMFITAQLAFLDGRNGRLLVAGAGHPPMLVANPRGEVWEIPASGPPLGIVADAAFPEHGCVWPGGHALMFTDGLTEARNRAGEFLGLDAVKTALSLAARNRESCDEARRRLITVLQDFEQETPPADDTAFIVIAGQNTNHS